MQELLLKLLARKQEMEEAVFSMPPSGWDEFNKRLGRWIEITEQIKDIEGKIQENDK